MPGKITGDKPPIPFLSPEVRDIAFRLMSKEVLRRAFRDVISVPGKEIQDLHDVHGEFGTADKWNERREQIGHWLKESNEITDIANQVIDDSSMAKELERDTRRELCDRIDECANNPALIADGLAERLADGGILPMYGMPTRSRLLYHEITKRSRFRSPLGIDRDLDLAITEFCPGAQKLKDKVIHTAIGFTPPLLQAGGRIRIGNDNDPLPEREWMLRCSHCQYAHIRQERFDDEICPNCDKKGKDIVRIFQIVTPAAFRTNLYRGSDAMKEIDTVTGAGTITIPGNKEAEIIPDMNCRALFYSGRVYKINDNHGRFFRGQLGTTQNFRGSSLENQWIDENFQNKPRVGVEFQPSSNLPEEFALSSGKTTDILRIRPEVTLKGLNMDPASILPNVGVKAAYYSAGFILRAVVAQELDIQPEELDIGNVLRVPSGDRFVGELVINDRLPNGSGFTRWLHGNLQQVLYNICNTEDAKNFVGKLTSKAHRKNCDAASYCCLSEYRNMNYHGLLDWRLGLCLLRCLTDQMFDCGLNGEFDAPFLSDWLTIANRQRDSICKSFSLEPKNFSKLPGFVMGNQQVIIIHPMWGHMHSTGELSLAIENAAPGAKFIDTFNLQRRPAKAYDSLARQS